MPCVVAHQCPAHTLPALGPCLPSLTSALQKTCCRFLSMEACCAATLGPCTLTSQLPPDPRVITSCARNTARKGGGMEKLMGWRKLPPDPWVIKSCELLQGAEWVEEGR